MALFKGRVDGALSQGANRMAREAPQRNAETLRRIEAKKRRGETAEAEAEGKAAHDRTMREDGRRKRR
jgi:hypothetical protein